MGWREGGKENEGGSKESMGRVDELKIYTIFLV